MHWDKKVSDYTVLKSLNDAPDDTEKFFDEIWCSIKKETYCEQHVTKWRKS